MQKNINIFKNKYQRLINQINNFEERLKILDNNELRIQTFKLKQQ